MADPKPARGQLVFSYNSFLVDFLLLAKRTGAEVKQRLKEQYRSVDKRDETHIRFAAENHPLSGLSAARPAGEDLAAFLARAPDVANAAIVGGVTFRDVFVPEGDEGLKSAALRNVYVMAALARLWQLGADDDADDDDGGDDGAGATLASVLDLVMRIDAAGKWAGWPEPAPALDALEADIARVTEDECLRGLLARLLDACAVQGLGHASGDKERGEDIPDALRDTFAKIENSKIGGLAKEIADEIDFSRIDPGQPADWLNLASIADPNSFLGGIVSKLGTKLTAKMQSGDIKQEDILGDAMSLMSSLGMGNPGMYPGGPAGAPDMLAMLSGMSGLMQQAQQPQKPQGKPPRRQHGRV